MCQYSKSQEASENLSSIIYLTTVFQCREKSRHFLLQYEGKERIKIH